MKKAWHSRFAENVRDFQGYPIGKTIKYLTDPEIISLAGGLPSPDVFQRSEVRLASQPGPGDTDRPHHAVLTDPGEATLVDAVLGFLERDRIHIDGTHRHHDVGGQHGLDLDRTALPRTRAISVLVDRPTFAGALVAFRCSGPDSSAWISRTTARISRACAGGWNSSPAATSLPKFIYVVPDFQNPSGITMSLAKRKALLDLSYEYDVPIVEDSPYRDLRYSGRAIPSIYSLDQKREGGHVIGLYTFSKLFCPGMRVGFNIGPAPVIERMTHIKEGNILNTPKYNQDICTAFLTEWDLEDHLRKVPGLLPREVGSFFRARWRSTFRPRPGSPGRSRRADCFSG